VRCGASQFAKNIIFGKIRIITGFSRTFTLSKDYWQRLNHIAEFPTSQDVEDSSFELIAPK
jgi:hypothetical protein